MSKIEWLGRLGRTWNPITGCLPGLPCWPHCWARRMALRLAANPAFSPELRARYHGFRPTYHPERLAELERVHRPTLWGAGLMGDLALQPRQVIAELWAALARHPGHRFLWLTKRPAQLAGILSGLPAELRRLPHVGLGVSCATQEDCDERIPLLLRLPAAFRCVSLEPLLGPIALAAEWLPSAQRGCEGELPSEDCDDCGHLARRLDWVIAGAETGPGARTPDLAWLRDLRDQVTAAAVPFFLKACNQLRDRDLDGRTWNERPAWCEVHQVAPPCTILHPRAPGGALPLSPEVPT
jgi:protein gp37